jgi:hydroxyethylthiazole kinase-like uncharacterized protein yjeF
LKIVSRREMSGLEEAMHQRGITSKALIGRVGIAISEQLKEMVEFPDTKNVAILVGPGNNGVDGLVTAPHLAAAGFSVDVFLCADKGRYDQGLIGALGERVECTDLTQTGLESFEEEIHQFDIVVDALLGIGRLRRIQGVMAQVLHDVAVSFQANPERLLVAIDIPSGMDADTGEVDDLTLRATHTLAVGNPKRGFFVSPGYRYVGAVKFLDIGINPEEGASIQCELTGIADFQNAKEFLHTTIDAHKGTKGHVLVIAGSSAYPGASILAAMAAYRAGCGLVTLVSPASIFPVIAGQLPEAIHVTYPDLESDGATKEAIRLIRTLEIGNYDSIVIGCGLGSGSFQSSFVKKIIEFIGNGSNSIPVVVDADALNCLAGMDSWWQNLGKNFILTPHPGEMGRLVLMATDDVQKKRLDIAHLLAKKVKQITVLKGAFTVIADREGNTYVNPHATSVLATAGTGDVLAGLIGSFLSQGLPQLLAVKLAVYVHGQAGEELGGIVGQRGVIASDVANYLPQVINKLMA